MSTDADARRHSPAAERNRVPIWPSCKRLLPAAGSALEVAAGTGQHAAHFAAALPGWTWWPSDAVADALPSISAWCDGLPNVRAPILLDVTAPHWPGVPAALDLVYCANMVHIAPWACCAGLMQGAARHAGPTAQLLLYGPFFVDGEPTAPGNLAFDVDLRERNAAWGLRRLSEVETVAQRAGWQLHERVAMPANNLLLVFGRR